MAKMPRIHLFLAAGVLIALTFALIYWRGQGDFTRVKPSQVETIQPPQSMGVADSRVTDVEPPQATPAIVPPASGICGNDDAACRSDPFSANSEEDLVWMRLHGYPTGDEASRLKSLSDAQLENEISGGSLTAMTELASRKIERSDWSGLQLLTQASDQGSIYSNYVRSSAMLKKGAPMGGLTESGAYLRLAYILGDYKAADALQNNFSRELSLTPREMSRIDERAASLYRTYAKSKVPVSRPH